MQNGSWAEVISCDLVCPRAAAAADSDEFAMAAFALVFVQITEVGKYRRTVPDVPESSFFDLAAVNFKISAGLYLAGMRDKAEGATAQTAARHSMQCIFGTRSAWPAVSLSLFKDAVIMGRAGGLELNGAIEALLVEPVQCVLIFVREIWPALTSLSPFLWERGGRYGEQQRPA